MTGIRVWLPLLVFVAIVGLVATALLRPADRAVHSALVGQPLPTIALPAMVAGKPGVALPRAAGGRPVLLNVFASWCIPCAAEAPQLLRLKALGVPIVAVATRDTPAAVAQFLARYGDPYAAIGNDAAGRTQLAIGSSGVPESFLIGGDGRILLQHIGDIRAEDVPAIARAAGAAS